MLFAELFSIATPVMAEIYADLSKQERIEKAVTECLCDSSLSVRKAAQIYKICHTTIT
jgi:helix-turn-helix, Psq domain